MSSSDIFLDYNKGKRSTLLNGFESVMSIIQRLGPKSWVHKAKVPIRKNGDMIRLKNPSSDFPLCVGSHASSTVLSSYDNDPLGRPKDSTINLDTSRLNTQTNFIDQIKIGLLRRTSSTLRLPLLSRMSSRTLPTPLQTVLVG